MRRAISQNGLRNGAGQVNTREEPDMPENIKSNAEKTDATKESGILTPNEYQELAMRTVNTDASKRDLLINAVMGLCGESGEAVDLVKKHIGQGHDFDVNHFVRELGDVAWYLAEAAYAVDYDLETVLRMNIDKLAARYPEGHFSVERSINRPEGDI